MSRRTLERVWTVKERADAIEIVEFVNDYHGDLIGAWHIAQMLGYSSPRGSGRERVYDIMPLASMLTAERYPGHTLAVVPDPGGALYKITTDVELATRTVRPRLNSVSTKILRLQAEVEALRADPSLRSTYLVTQVNSLAAQIKAIAPAMDQIDAIERAQADSAD